MAADTSAVIAPDLRNRLVGHRFPDGESMIQPHEAWLGHDAMQAPDHGADELHSLWALIVGVRGMGATISELSELAEMGATDTLMFGELRIEHHLPSLSIGTTYTVRGEITDVVRRTGRRAGVFDVITVELELYSPARDHVATVANSFVFVRGM